MIFIWHKRYFLYVLLAIHFNPNINRTMAKKMLQMTYTSTVNTCNDFLIHPRWQSPRPSPRIRSNPESATATVTHGRCIKEQMMHIVVDQAWPGLPSLHCPLHKYSQYYNLLMIISVINAVADPGFDLRGGGGLCQRGGEGGRKNIESVNFWSISPFLVQHVLGPYFY